MQALNSAGYRTIRYNHVGHGGSTPPPKGQLFHFDDFAAHMRAILEHVTGSSQAYAVIGCSMGGVLAVRYAMLNPGAVQRVMCCDAPGLTSLEESKPKWRARIEQFAAGGGHELAGATAERWFPQPCSRETIDEGANMTRSCSLEGYTACAEGIMNYDYHAQLSSLKTKTLVLVGDKDEAVGPYEVLEDVARQIPGAEYVRLKDCGHIPPMHRPAEFNETMLRFLG